MQRSVGGETFWAPIVARLFDGWSLAFFLGLIMTTSLVVLWPGIVEYLVTAHLTLHWSRLLVGGFGLLILFQTCITSVLMKVIGIWGVHRTAAGRSWRVQSLPPEQLDRERVAIVH